MCLPREHPDESDIALPVMAITNCLVAIRWPGVGERRVKPTYMVWLMRNSYHLRRPLQRFATGSPIMQNGAKSCTIRRAARARIQLWNQVRKHCGGLKVEAGPTGVKLSLAPLPRGPIVAEGAPVPADSAHTSHSGYSLSGAFR